MQYLEQAEFRVNFDWGEDGLDSLSSPEGITVIVDVLSFSTCVSIAMDRQAEVFPYRFKDESAEGFAQQVGARLARSRKEKTGLSLSPASMMKLGPGEKVVLPSPNGSTLSLEAKGRFVIAGCLRNREAVAGFINRSGLEVTVIAAGERWPNGNIRYAIEDHLGAGAILAGLKGRFSPEAELAAEAFQANQGRIRERIEESVSGRELAEWGFKDDIDIACRMAESRLVPILRDRRYIGETAER